MNDEILQLAESSKGQDPPATDMFFSNRARLQSNVLRPLWLGTAIGLAWASLFLLGSLVVAAGGGAILDFFKFLYPGFNLGDIVGILLGFAWSFLYGFIFGILVGLIYNSLLCGGLDDTESYDIYG
jgi:hypothetical protein